MDPWIANLWTALADVCVQKQNGENGKSEKHEENGKSESQENGKSESKGDGENENSVISSVKDLSIKETETRPPELHVTNGSESRTIGNKILLDLSELANSTQLTAIPRVPIEHCKIIKSNKGKDPSSSLPSFIITPNPIINAKLDAARCLTRFDAVKKTLHMELDITDHSNEIQFLPGDAFGIIAPNENSLVQNLLAILGIDEKGANQEISVGPVGRENGIRCDSLSHSWRDI